MNSELKSWFGIFFFGDISGALFGARFDFFIACLLLCFIWRRLVNCLVVFFVLLLVFFPVRSGVYLSRACPLSFPWFSVWGGYDALFFALCSQPFRAFCHGMFCRYRFACFPRVFVVLFRVFFAFLFFRCCFFVFYCAPCKSYPRQTTMSFWILVTTS